MTSLDIEVLCHDDADRPVLSDHNGTPEMFPLDRSADEAMWLKFLIIWRFARLWALCDGIEVVENMQRCVCHLAV